MSRLAATFTAFAAFNVLAIYLHDAVRRFAGAAAVRREPSDVAPNVNRSADLALYFATIPFVNGDAWEVLR
jgi:hypothetical protein